MLRRLAIPPDPLGRLLGQLTVGAGPRHPLTPHFHLPRPGKGGQRENQTSATGSALAAYALADFPSSATTHVSRRGIAGTYGLGILGRRVTALLG